MKQAVSQKAVTTAASMMQKLIFCSCFQILISYSAEMDHNSLSIDLLK